MNKDLNERKRKEIERVLSNEKPLYKHKAPFTPESGEAISALFEARLLNQTHEIFISNKVVDYGAVTRMGYEAENNVWEFSILAYSGWDRDIEHKHMLKVINPRDFKLYAQGFIIINAEAVIWDEETQTTTETPVVAFL